MLIYEGDARCWYCLLAVMWSSVLVDSVDVLLGMSCAECCGPFLLPHAILQHPYSLMLIQSHHSHHETIMVCPVLQIHDVAISWAHPGTWQVGKVGQIGLKNNVGKWWGSVSSVGVRCFLFDVCKVRSYWNRIIKNRLCNNHSNFSQLVIPLSFRCCHGSPWWVAGTLSRSWSLENAHSEVHRPKTSVKKQPHTSLLSGYRQKKTKGNVYIDPFLVRNLEEHKSNAYFTINYHELRNLTAFRLLWVK